MCNKRIFKGFSILEMGIILVVLGLVIGASIPFLRSGLETGRTKKGVGGLGVLKNEIIGFAINAGNTGTSVLPQDISGFLSFQDAWGRDVRYYPANGLTTDICSASGTALEMQYDDGSGTVQTFSDIAFILTSDGKNAREQVGRTGLTGAMATGFSGSVTTYSMAEYTKKFSENMPLDDIVDYVSLDYLQSVACSTEDPEPPIEKLPGISFEDDGVNNLFEAPKKGKGQGSGAYKKGSVVFDTAKNELTLGSSKPNERVCLWFEGDDLLAECERVSASDSKVGNPVICKKDDWTSLRFVFSFRTLNLDYRSFSQKSRYGGGFTFAIINGTILENRNGYPKYTAPCGNFTSQGLAYSSDIGNDQNDLEFPKFGVEFDMENNGPLPKWIYDPGGNALERLNHVGVIYWDFAFSDHTYDNYHGRSNVSGIPYTYAHKIPHYVKTTSEVSAGTSAAVNTDGILTVKEASGAPMWLEDTKAQWVRIELVRDNISTAHTNSPVNYTMHVWLTSDEKLTKTFQDLGVTLNSSGVLGTDFLYRTSHTTKWDLKGDLFDHDSNILTSKKFNINEMMNQFRFGWTMVTGNGNSLINNKRFQGFTLGGFRFFME